MRLFMALNFNCKVKTKVEELISKVESNAVQGRFINEDHLHITLEFLGETENHRGHLVKKVMDSLDYEAFTLKLTEIGYFKGRKGNTYWLGIERNVTLLNLQKELHQRLMENGFELGKKEYKPHITIGRKVILADDFDLSALDHLVKKIKINIDRIDLMESKSVDGKLQYAVIHSKYLL